MPMPETAVDKYGNFPARQSYIRASRQLSAVPSLRATKRADYSTNDPFGLCVPRLYAAHDTAALGGGERIHVRQSLDYSQYQYNRLSTVSGFEHLRRIVCLLWDL